MQLFVFLLEIEASSSIIINARQVRSHNTGDEQVAVCVHVCVGGPLHRSSLSGPLWPNRPPDVPFLFGARPVGRV